LPLHGKTVLEHSLQLLLKVARLQRIVVVVHPHDQRWRELPVFADPRIVTAEGGDERCHSVLKRSATVDGIADASDVGAGARCCTTLLPVADIERLLDQLVQHPVGGLLAVPAS